MAVARLPAPTSTSPWWWAVAASEWPGFVALRLVVAHVSFDEQQVRVPRLRQVFGSFTDRFGRASENNVLEDVQPGAATYVHRSKPRRAATSAIDVTPTC